MIRSPNRPPLRALIAALLLLLLAPALAIAQATPPAPNAAPPDPDPAFVDAAGQVAFGYVLTGDAEVDDASAAGLLGLSYGLYMRTTVEPGPPVAVDLDTADLSLLTFLYWPVTDSQLPPSTQAYLRLNQFLRTGGVILFDTRDGDIGGTGGPDDGSAALQSLAAPLEIPPLVPLPEDHVLTRSFYLLTDLPGRYFGQPVWVEAPTIRTEDEDQGPLPVRNDGVSPVIIGGNNWAEAWAIDGNGLPLYNLGSGFEGEDQREMALRAGINIIMYVLTGNYKSDQVHVPELLERLGMEDAAARMGMPEGGFAPGVPVPEVRRAPGDLLDTPLFPQSGPPQPPAAPGLLP